MLTKAQIQQIAQRSGIGIQVQERDYLQHLLLWLLYSRTQALIYKGGTALRMVYSGNRYSEDLDFNGPSDVAVLQSLWQEIVTRLRDFGISAEKRREWISDVGYSFDVSFQGPLYDGRARSKGKVRVDVNRRPEDVTVRRELVKSKYDDVRPFVVTVLTPEHLLAEKMRALLVRGKPRDLYDIWLMLNQGVRLDDGLLQCKLALYQMTWKRDELAATLDRVGTDWERDLRHLLPQFVPYEIVRADVLARLD
ncbi:MAG TPA: nucleotidyl transferase AbiEii/AbiGii toxin family protein [Anaerolineae bacterium]|nr:nucleotidyl transferase AbiEii/AbiGii toxin family protein [Anaerolineae bacterium]HNS52670.1 nucleotidyl transferase AbiEii/AbiGii toxin family protein [Anaerolineae bacterium]